MSPLVGPLCTDCSMAMGLRCIWARAVLVSVHAFT